jgi:hypothetical protein
MASRKQHSYVTEADLSYLIVPITDCPTAYDQKTNIGIILYDFP